tara:strand:- start:1046 stop:1912 length:867 start_codon:yes stop_codon:yes gene_type:complete
MARKNSDRLNLTHEPPSDESPPAPALTGGSNEDSIFSFVTPTEFVELPSKGEYYTETHPLHGLDTIEIRHMTAKEEDILTSEALLKKGIALDRLLQAVIINKAIKVNDLLIGDKNALLIAARKTGYGPFYDTELTCPGCNDTTEQSLNLNDLKIKTMKLPDNVTSTAEGNYVIHYEEANLRIEVKLLKGHDEKLVAGKRETRRKRKLPDAMITDQLEAIIVGVNDITERALIKRFVQEVPAMISRQIRNTYDELTPDLDLNFDFECEECGHMGKVGMPLTAAFFWPNA